MESVDNEGNEEHGFWKQEGVYNIEIISSGDDGEDSSMLDQHGSAAANQGRGQDRQKKPPAATLRLIASSFPRKTMWLCGVLAVVTLALLAVDTNPFWANGGVERGKGKSGKRAEKGRGSHGSDGGMEMWGESKEDEIDGNSGSGDSVLRGGMRKGIGKLNRAVLSKATLHEQLECIQHLAAIVRRAMDDDGGSKSGGRGASGEGGAEAGVVADA